MKNEKDYVLLVYIVFGIELLINILFMIFYKKILNWDQLTFDGGIESSIKSIGIGLIPIVIVRLVIEIRIIKDKVNKSLVWCYLILILMLCCLYGAMLAVVDTICNIVNFNNVVEYTFWITVVIFMGMTIGGYFTQRKNYNHPILNNVFIGSFIIFVFNMFWGWNWVNIIIDIVDLVIVSLFIYLDTIKIKQHAKELTQINKTGRILNILRDATDIYEDFIFIWIDLIDLIFESADD